MVHFWSGWIRRLGIIAAALIILSGFLMGLTDLLTPYLTERRHDFEAWIKSTFQVPITIDRVKIRWCDFEPTFAFENVAVLNRETLKPTLTIRQVQISLAVFESLIKRTIVPENIAITGVQLTVHQLQEGQFSVDELPIRDNTTGQSLDTQQALAWILSQSQIELNSVYVTYIPLQHEEAHFKLYWLDLRSLGKQHVLKANVALDQAIKTSLSTKIIWHGDITDYSNLSLQAHVAVKEMNVSQWMSYFPSTFVTLQKGIVNLEGWASLEKGQWKYFQFVTNMRDVAFNLKSVFANDIQLEHLAAQALLNKKADGSWSVKTKDIQLANRDLSANASMDLMIPLAGSAEMDLTGYFKVQNVSHISNYLPLVTFDHDLVVWLRSAFLKGEVEAGHARVKGLVSDFPFDRAPGTFEISGKVKNVDLHYAPDWPIIRHINGDLTFKGQSMIAKIDSGAILGLPIKTVEANIPYLGSDQPALLNVTGAFQGDLSQGIQFIRQSPLRDTVGKNMAQLELSGPMQATLQLLIPLDDTDKTHVKGDVSLSNASLNLPAWSLSFSHLEGQFHFTENDFTSSPLHADFFNRPITFSLSTEHPAKQSARIVTGFQSVISVQEIERWLNMSLSSVAQGQTAYHVSLQLPQSEAPTVLLETNLKGMGLEVPEPFGKSANEEVPLTATIVPGAVSKIQYGPSIQFTVETTRQNWTLGVKSADLSGKVTVPNGLKGRVQANFDRLSLGDQLKLSKTSSLRPETWPPIDFFGREVRYGQLSLGQVKASLRPSPKGVVIDALKIESPLSHLDASGEWQVNNGRHFTHLEGVLSTSHLSSLLNEWGFTLTDFVANDGHADFDLSWPGMPSQPSLLGLSGTLSLSIGAGRIINVGQSNDVKMSIGHLLNILSLQSLPRHLTGDFSDFQKGYHFDSLKGQFAFQGGDAFTKNTRFDGPIARIDIAGRIGLSAKDMDLSVGVTPHVTESLPVAAALVGGPIAGVATWVVDRAVSGAVSHVSTFRYNVTGAWDNPKWNAER